MNFLSILNKLTDKYYIIFSIIFGYIYTLIIVKIANFFYKANFFDYYRNISTFLLVTIFLTILIFFVSKKFSRAISWGSILGLIGGYIFSSFHRYA